MLGACTSQTDRLPAARTIVTRTKTVQKAAAAAKTGLASLVRSATALASEPITVTELISHQHCMGNRR